MISSISRNFRSSKHVPFLLKSSSSKSTLISRSKSFLSQEFNCQNAWNERLKSPIFSRIEMSKYFFEIERKFLLEGRGSAVDVEIFSNATLISSSGSPLSDEIRSERLEQLEELLRRFRQTEQTCLMLPSTHHAVARAFVDGGYTDTLMRILNNRVEFGVFPDAYTYTYLLDHFLSNENYRDGSKVAIAMMLQEEFKIPIASQMGLYSTYAYVQNLKDHTEPWDPQPPPPIEEPEEEVKIRVPFLESSYKDDHFDLTLREHLLGKTLAKFSSNGLLGDTADVPLVKKSLAILGWTLFEKWDTVVDLCNDGKATLDEDCIRQAQSLAEENSSDASSAAAKSLGQLSLIDFDVKTFLETEVNKSVQEHETKFIQMHTDNLRAWDVEREAELENQYKLFLKESKLKELADTARQLAEKEEELFFFDNYDKMEKQKLEKFGEWRRTWPRRTWARQINMGKVENHNKFKAN